MNGISNADLRQLSADIIRAAKAAWEDPAIRQRYEAWLASRNEGGTHGKNRSEDRRAG